MSENAKAVMRRWYDEMWSQKNTELISELAGPVYVRHESGGTRSITAEEYREQLQAMVPAWEITDMHYSLVSEGDKVVAIGSWKVDGKQMDWVQCVRVENDKLVETWLSGIGMESRWGDDAYANLDTIVIPD